jgi:prepilin-type N-terminal cleavage/methylation domain-containing protein
VFPVAGNYRSSSSRRVRDRAVAAGFTILELMIASSIFAVILLVLAVGVIRVTNDYYKGINSSKTQANARSIITELTQAIQFGKNITITQVDKGTNIGGVCVDNTLYSFQLGQQVIDDSPKSSLHQGYHALVVTTGSDCRNTKPSIPPNSDPLPAGQRELVGERIRLNALTVTPTKGVYIIRVRLVYGDDDLLTPTVSDSTDWANTDEGCLSGAGSQFCAASDLTTNIGQRLL